MEKAAKTAPAKSVDEYLQTLPGALRTTLEKSLNSIFLLTNSTGMSFIDPGMIHNTERRIHGHNIQTTEL